MENKKKLMETIYEGLSKEISPDAIQSTSFGAKTDGYKAGFLVERLNEVLLPLGCNWGYELIPIVLANGVGSTFLRETNAKDKEIITVRVCVSFYGPDGDVINRQESFGGCQFLNNSTGDTLKGATTDAIKKAFSYMGLGNHAFKGCVDDQVKYASFRRDEVFDKTKQALSKKYKVEISNENLLSYIQKTLCKTLGSFEDVMYDELDIIEASTKEFDTPKKEEVPNEKTTGKSKSTKGKASTKGKELDLQLDDNNETAY